MNTLGDFVPWRPRSRRPGLRHGAREWYQKAVDAGNTNAKQALSGLLELP